MSSILKCDLCGEIIDPKQVVLGSVPGVQGKVQMQVRAFVSGYDHPYGFLSEGGDACLACLQEALRTGRVTEAPESGITLL